MWGSHFHFTPDFGLRPPPSSNPCFDEIKRHRLAVILDQALALPLVDQRRVVYLARYGDLCVKQLALGTARHLAPCTPKSYKLRCSAPLATPQVP